MGYEIKISGAHTTRDTREAVEQKVRSFVSSLEQVLSWSVTDDVGTVGTTEQTAKAAEDEIPF